MIAPKPWEAPGSTSQETPHTPEKRYYRAFYVYCKTVEDEDKLIGFMNEHRSQYDYEESEEYPIERGSPFSADLE